MTSRLHYAWTLLPLTGFMLYGYLHVNLVPMDNYLETFLWTFRSWRLTQPISQNISDWSAPRDDDEDEYMRRSFRAMNSWKFLSPFFASRGYTLYTRATSRGSLLLPPSRPPAATSQEYPFARLLGTPEEYDYGVMRVWPARDRSGRDVIIKLVSDSKSSRELEALRRLNTSSARLDPRNNTIPVLEFLNWGALVFAVMPRWFCAFDPDFQYLVEAVHLWEQLLVGLEFCHEHRVAHCDILEQNTMLDVLTAKDSMGELTGVMGPESRYVFIDFGHASVFTQKMSLSDAPLREDMVFEMRPGLGPRRPCNPFVADIMFLGAMMQRLIKMASDVFPEGVHLIDKMMGLNGHSVPTASQALSELRTIKSRLSDDTLQFYLPGIMWTNHSDEGPRIAPRDKV